MEKCTADENKKNNYNWSASGTPSALGYKVTFGVAKIISCTSKNGKNNIGGAKLSGNCTGFKLYRQEKNTGHPIDAHVPERHNFAALFC